MKAKKDVLLPENPPACEEYAPPIIGGGGYAPPLEGGG